MADDDAPLREPDVLSGVPYPEQTGRLVGHADALQGLIAQFDAKRPPSGVLIHGPRGIGKATLAFAVVRHVLEKTGDESAERVAAQIAAGSHPNVRVLRRTIDEKTKKFHTVIRVKEVRDTTTKAHQTRGRAGHRFVIVDSIDNANTESDNALLKVLEEPPNDMTFILVSHRPSALPPTVLSRTQKLALRPLSNAEVAEILAHSGAGGLSLQQAVALAQGRPRRGFEALAVAGVKTMTGLLDWLKAPALQPLKAHLDLADALGAARDSAETKFARDLIVDWIAAEARAAALAGEGARLASANRLWDKARTLFAEVDVYNLDMRQTLTALFDAIRNHLIESPAAASP